MRVAPLCLLLASLIHLCCKKSIEVQNDYMRPADLVDTNEINKKPVDTVPFKKIERRRPIVITGSSTVALWPDSSFASMDVIRVGGGGYHFGEMLYGSSRKPAIGWDSLLELHPRQWVIQGGDNDIYYKRSLPSIKADIKKIVTKLVTTVPDIRIDFIYAKPTGPNEQVVYRIDSIPVNGWSATEKLNNDIARWGSATFPRNFYALNFYDPLLLNEPKRLDVKFFRNDLVHLNAAHGYRLLDSLLRPRLLN